MPDRLISYEGRFKTGTKQQHTTSSFDKYFGRNLSKDCVTELENQSKQNEVVNGLLISFLKTYYAGSTEKHFLKETDPNGSSNSCIERLSQESKEKISYKSSNTE